MRKVRLTLAAAACCTLLYSVAEAKVYKWVDNNGVTHYGETIPPEYASKDNVQLDEKGRVVVDAQKLSDALADAIETRIARAEQSLVLVNRRGFAPLTLCRVCGHRFQCPQCSSWLVEHRYSGRLICHLTGFTMDKPLHCPHCGALPSFA